MVSLHLLSRHSHYGWKGGSVLYQSQCVALSYLQMSTLIPLVLPFHAEAGSLKAVSVAPWPTYDA
eukprot:3374211-Pleurochrysis_carterae.AAC.4